MPTLPSADRMEMNVPRPSRGVVDIGTAPLDRGGEALIGLGELIDKEFERLEDIQVQDALNKLRERRIDLTVGENGFSRKKAGDVVNEPVLDDFSGAFAREVDTLGGNFRTNQARAKFQQRAQAEANSYKLDLVRHVTGETDAYQTTVFAAGLENAARTITLNAARPAEVMNEVAKAGDLINAELDRRGFAADTPENTKIRDAFRQEQLGGALTTAVSTLIAEDRIGEAKQIFESYEKAGAFTAQQIATIKPKLKAGEDWANGSSLGERAFAMLSMGTPQVEVERFLNKNAGSASELNAARVAYGRMVGAREAQWGEAGRAALQDMVNRSDGTNTDSQWLAVRSKYIGQMDPQAVLALDRAAEREASGGTTKTDLDLWYELYEQASSPSSSDEFARSDLLKYKDRLSRTDFQALSRVQADIRTGKNIKNLETVKQIVSDVAVTQRWGTSPAGKAKSATYARWLNDEIRREREDNDLVVVSDVRVRELARRGLEPVEYPDTNWLGRPTTRSKPRFEFDTGVAEGTLQPGAAEPARVPIPASIRAEIAREYRSARGQTPDEGTIQRLYQQYYAPNQGN